MTPDLPPDEDPLLHARRLVAQRCLYGVDKNPLAVDLARLSMWLVTFAKEHPFTFVDHALRAGDSLVGLSKDQIIDLTPFPIESGAEAEKKPAKGKKAAAKQPTTQLDLVRPQVVKAVEKADELRQQIHAIGDPPDNAELRRLWKDTNDALARVRLLGDLVVAAYFGADTDKTRKTAIENLRAKVQHWLSTGELEAELRGMVAELREGERPLEPFHWEIEFPEVFGRENPGFDCFVGNPPFMGGMRISTHLGMRYFAYLTDLFPPAAHQCDLVAYFFRRAFFCTRLDGTIGFVATNTVAQGDTREGGLAWICSRSGSIYSARRRLRWPGQAAVVVSVVHLLKGIWEGVSTLDGTHVSRISAYLLKGQADATAARLAGRNDLFSKGSQIYGQGFLFDDDDEKANPSSEIQRILREEPASKARILPFLGGEDVNSSPTQSPRRHVIYLSDVEREDMLSQWPELASVVRRKVKTERDRLGDNPNNIPLKRKWWAYQAHRPYLYAQLAMLRRALVCSQTSKHICFSFARPDVVFDQTVVVFLSERDSFFSAMSSRVHEAWARFLGASMKDDPRYIPSDCFETFPFPDVGEPREDALEAIGKEYYEFRAALMADETVRAKLMEGLPPEGLTKTYNKFHDPDCHLPGIVRLRELHAQMDRAVLDAYGWQDIRPEYDFREQLDESVRLTWAEETRDEVLARLLELNRVMAEAEAAEAAKGEEAKKVEKATRKTEQKAAGAEDKKPRGGRKKGEPEGQGGLFS